MVLKTTKKSLTNPPTIILFAQFACIGAFLLLVEHYVFVIRFNTSLATIFFTLTSLVLGYYFWFQSRQNWFSATLTSVVISLGSVWLMSLAVSWVFSQPVFPDRRQIQDFFETAFMIAFGFLAGCSIASLVLDQIGHSQLQLGPTASIFRMLSRAARTPIAPVAKGIRSIDGIAKAMLALVLTATALIVAAKKLFFG